MPSHAGEYSSRYAWERPVRGHRTHRQVLAAVLRVQYLVKHQGMTLRAALCEVELNQQLYYKYKDNPNAPDGRTGYKSDRVTYPKKPDVQMIASNFSELMDAIVAFDDACNTIRSFGIRFDIVMKVPV